MEALKLPVGALAARAVDWLTAHGAAAFDAAAPKNGGAVTPRATV